MNGQNLPELLQKHQQHFYPVVPATAHGKLVSVDLTAANKNLEPAVYSDTARFAAWINDWLSTHSASFAAGGYNELRVIYAASTHFDAGAEPRRLHLGIDIWGPAGTAVHAFMGGRVHSIAFNDHPGDYGATVILQHQLEGCSFHTLYGHIALHNIVDRKPGQYVVRGEQIANFGLPRENGHWPPHLHFQVIIDMQLKEGDYPGVCRNSEREYYLKNCPDPDTILQLREKTLSPAQ